VSRRVVVVGAGILGLAVARQLTRSYPGLSVTVLDKEHEVGAHQTGHNSGVVHAGLYYPPGSLKATLCRRGAGLLRDYCSAHHLPFQTPGKLVVATDAVEVERLRTLHGRAAQNRVDVRWVDEGGIADIEPYVTGLAAVHSPSTAITDFRAVARQYASDLQAAGGTVLLDHGVTGIEATATGVLVRTPRRHLPADHVLLCAGLHSGRLARVAGDRADPAIVPFRGEYLDLRPQVAHRVRGLVYPVPDPAYPFLGVHLTRRVDGTVDLGPNAVLAGALEGYRRRDLHLVDLARTLTTPGFGRFAARHWRTGVDEVLGSLSRRRFVRRAQRYLPSLTPSDVVPGATGVRAQALDPDGALVDDFRIHHLGRVTAVRNAPSPAATSSLAIAEHVVADLARHGVLPAVPVQAL
jgi:L-2-hydroxyglutarate oxidase LhgO